MPRRSQSGHVANLRTLHNTTPTPAGSGRINGPHSLGLGEAALQSCSFPPFPSTPFPSLPFVDTHKIQQHFASCYTMIQATFAWSGLVWSGLTYNLEPGLDLVPSPSLLRCRQSPAPDSLPCRRRSSTLSLLPVPRLHLFPFPFPQALLHHQPAASPVVGNRKIRIKRKCGTAKDTPKENIVRRTGTGRATIHPVHSVGWNNITTRLVGDFCLRRSSCHVLHMWSHLSSMVSNAFGISTVQQRA